MCHSLQQDYHIPRDTCSTRDFAKNITDGNFLYEKRCVPVNQYYGMLLRDTPGYIPEAPRRTRSPRKDVMPEPRAKKTEASRDQVDPNSFRHRADGKFHPRSDKTPSAILDRGRSHEPLVAHESSSAIPGTVYTGGSIGRAAAGQDPRYDHRLSNDDKRRIDEFERDIRRIKQRTASKNYVDARDKALNRAETARKSGKETPRWLKDARPPWNDGTGMAITRYDEMMIEEIRRHILDVRSDNATIRVLEDVDKAKGGPGGQVRR